jgi:hypothetical protein
MRGLKSVGRIAAAYSAVTDALRGPDRVRARCRLIGPEGWQAILVLCTLVFTFGLCMALV